MIAKITQVLVQTHSISEDPVSGAYEQLFFEGILRSLHHDKFHPGMLNASGADGLDGFSLAQHRWNRFEKRYR